MLPALLRVVTPALRPVAERLLHTAERSTLAAVTDTMLAYSLRFDQRSSGPLAVPGHGRQPVTHVPLDPPVDRFCAFQVASSSSLAL